MLPHVFLTGATGLLGSELLTRLLASGRQVAVLARPSRRSSPRERIESILAEAEVALGRRLPRPVVLEGDLTSDACGLAAAEIAWLRKSCSRIVHSAASLEFVGEDRAGEPWRSNVGGTKAVLELARRAEIDNFHHVSTAYVCGLSPGPIAEAPSDAAHGFRNDYEASKHEAEWLVRSAPFLREPTFYRPAVIVGHSQTGATTTYHGLMAMLQLMTVIVRNLPADETGFRKVSLRLSMTGEERRNMIPVDWVADVIAHLLDTPGTRGRIFHLAPERPITIRQIIDFTSSYLNSGGVEFCGPRKPDELNDTESAAYGGKGLYEAYEQTDPPFAMDNLHRFASHLPCPVIDEAMMHRFLAYGDADRWGKRKRPTPTVETWANELLRGLEADDLFVLARALVPSNDPSPPPAVGLELLGPGGGSWTIRLGSDATAVLEPGIAADAVRVTNDVAHAEAMVRQLCSRQPQPGAAASACHDSTAHQATGSTVAAS